MAFRTSNPTLREDTFNRYAYLTGTDASERMTINGTLTKSLCLLFFAVVTATFAWSTFRVSPELAMPGTIGAAVIGFIVGLVVSFSPKTAPILAPVYALVEGFALGAISYVLNVAYPGIVAQAVPITLCVMFAMLALYRAGILRATPMFVRVVVFSTCGIALVYLFDIGLRLFGIQMPYLHDATPLGIAISLGICVVAALNFILDFDLIERGSEQGAPKFMEWYAAFSLMVTLFWLYLEILRLLAKMRR